jgi:hypothetical protein
MAHTVTALRISIGSTKSLSGMGPQINQSSNLGVSSYFTSTSELRLNGWSGGGVQVRRPPSPWESQTQEFATIGLLFC